MINQSIRFVGSVQHSTTPLPLIPLPDLGLQRAEPPPSLTTGEPSRLALLSASDRARVVFRLSRTGAVPRFASSPPRGPARNGRQRRRRGGGRHRTGQREPHPNIPGR